MAEQQQTQQQANPEWSMPAQGNATPPEQLPPDFRGPSRDELLAAVKEAGGTDSVDVETEEAKATEAAATDADAAKVGKTAAAAKAKETDAAAADAPAEPKIAAVIRAREEAQRKRDEAEDHAQRLMDDASARAQKLIEDARAKAAEDYQREIDARRARFQQDPTAALRELGDPQTIVDTVVRSGTPEARALREMQDRVTQAESKAKTAEQVATEFGAFKKQLEQERYIEQVRAVEHQFLSEHASPDKAPYLHKRYDPPEILARAHEKAAEWRKAGVQFAHSDVAEYLEFEARKRLVGDASVPPQQVSGGAEKSAGNATKVKANGSRTLSAASGSERRSSPKPIREMTADEERDALIAEAAAERKRLGNPDV